MLFSALPEKLAFAEIQAPRGQDPFLDDPGLLAQRRFLDVAFSYI